MSRVRKHKKLNNAQLFTFTQAVHTLLLNFADKVTSVRT